MTASERLRRSEWTVEPIGHRDAVELIAQLHYAGGAPNTAVARHGLRRVDDLTLRGVALWLPPLPGAARSVSPDTPRSVLALSRLVVDDDVPRNGASYLLGASMRLLDRERWPTLLTYADTRHGHTGAIYRATNWACLGQVPGSSHTWRHRITGEQRSAKRTRNVTADVMRAEGYEYFPPVPKIKYVHEASR